MASVPTPAPGLPRRFVTPEGVDLRLQLATAGQRAAAFLLDGCIIIGTLIAVTIGLAILAIAGGNSSAAIGAAIVWLLMFFVLRNLYFIGFELGGRAATPGKRSVGLRVVARDGGRLTADAVIARNLVREIEVYLPLTFLGYQSMESGAESWMVVAGLVWTGVFTFFPLFNRDRLRAGDFIAGTWVVHAPRSGVGADLAAAVPARTYSFSREQLDAYGIYELQTLEDVLRRGDPAALATVAASIRGRIGWLAGDDDAAFLSAYYDALCTKLESRLLLGRRRENKHDRP